MPRAWTGRSDLTAAGADSLQPVRKPARHEGVTREHTLDPPSDASIVPAERIERAIVVLRGQKVMLDADLAGLYGVATKVLNQAVRRNRERFPIDFMFELTPEEAASLRSQIVTSKGRGGRRHVPLAFTEQGVAMLSSVLRSRQAVAVNVEIMRAFVRLREMLQSNAELTRKLAALERRYDAQFRVVFDAIRELMAQPAATKRRIGFQLDEPR